MGSQKLNKKHDQERIEECAKVIYGAMKWLLVFSLILEIPMAVFCGIVNPQNGFSQNLLSYYIYPVVLEVCLVIFTVLLCTRLKEKMSFWIFSCISLFVVTLYADVIVAAYREMGMLSMLLVLPVAFLSVFRSKRTTLIQVLYSLAFYAVDIFRFPQITVEKEHLGDVMELTAFVFILICFIVVAEQVRAATTLLDIQTSKDSLTGLYNHEAFYVRLEEEMENYDKNGEPFCIMIADIDNFKKVNDTYGHVYGDEVLGIVSSILKKNQGSRDFVSRYGGEEFAMIMPDCTKPDAIGKADKIRKEMENYSFLTSDGEKHFTLSVGVAEYTRRYDSSSKFVDMADEALYEAKSSGKNKVCFKKV